MTKFQIKRIYDEPAASDGYRVLVDRLWPRGVSKERAALDDWNKDVAPSPDLRVWFHHQADRFDEFATRYKAELQASGAADRFCEATKDKAVVTLLFAARDVQNDHTPVLCEYLTKKQ